MLTVIEWEDLLSPLDIQSAYNEFALRLISIINDCVPFETPRLRKNLFMTWAALHLKTQNVSYGTNISVVSPQQITKYIVNLETSCVT